MAPRKKVDKGKAPMVEEEPVGRRTRSRTTGVIIREAQAEASHSEPVTETTQIEQEEVVMESKTEPGKPEPDRAERSAIQPGDVVDSSTQASTMMPQMAVMITMMAGMVRDLQDFLQAQNRQRGRDSESRKKKKARTVISDKFCRYCKRTGHMISECSILLARSGGRPPRSVTVPARGIGQGSNQTRKQRPIICYLCKEAGHTRRFCPRLRKTESGTSSASQPPEQRAEYLIGRGQASRVPLICYLCSEPGHPRGQCPRLGRVENVTSPAPPQLVQSGGSQEVSAVEMVTTGGQATHAQEEQATENVVTDNVDA